eukprot:TRINITY_DN7382_c0_g1_i1.p1 TRINITY_DN7382_c0_g1~~TRINITY_DN7382_c0_g1_i1.p1  ORF type:complete len:261 (+),score=2.43 TRINITY_DN7382_c0_g1_i1:70-852(+)
MARSSSDFMYRAAKICGYSVILMVSGMLGFSYYTIVVQTLWRTFIMSNRVGYQLLGAVELLVFHLLFILTSVSYFRTVFTNPGFVEPQELDREAMMNVRDLKACTKCNVMKPERAHHCKLCRRCVWVNNCVGWNNYKYFVLLLNYAPAYCINVLIIIAVRFGVWGFQRDGRASGTDLQVLITALMGLAILMAATILCMYHWKLLRENKTTIEDHIKDNPYDLGPSENIREVCGNVKWRWLLPIFSANRDGYNFPRNTSAL